MINEAPNATPPGQAFTTTFPRFGMLPFANRFPTQLDPIRLAIRGEVELKIALSEQLDQLERVEQQSDFHCVTTWSVPALNWSGFRFSDVYKQLIVPLAQPAAGVEYVTFVGQDGYRTSLLLADLLKADVLLADRLNGERLSVEHGAPIRLVAPAHYGYKNVKHLKRIDFYSTYKNYHPWPFQFMDHPRGRVVEEERGNIYPNWILRPLYRSFIKFTIRRFENGMALYSS